MILANSGWDVFVTIFTGLSASVILPVIFFIVGISFGQKPKDALISGMTLGIAFIGMGMLISFMFGFMQEAMERFGALTGLQLKALDLGWTAMAGLSWAFIYGLLMFPIMIIINIIMLLCGFTKTLNLDLWNIWNKIFQIILIQTLLRWAGANVYFSISLAIVLTSIQVVMELINADNQQKLVFKATGINGISVCHQMTLFGAALWPAEWLMRKIKFLNKNFDAKTLRKKLGILGNSGVIGLIVGFLIGIIAYWPSSSSDAADIYKAFVVAIQTATALVLFPIIAKLFMQALTPIASTVEKLMKKKFGNRQIFIGLDWPVLAGIQEIWVAIIIWVPFTLLFSFGISAWLSNSNTNLLPLLPLASLLNTALGAPAFLVTGGNLVRMIIIGIIYQPIALLFAAWVGPIISEYITQNPEVLKSIISDQSLIDKITSGEIAISSAVFDDILFKFALTYFAFIFAPNLSDPIFSISHPWAIGLCTFTLWLVLYIWFYKGTQKMADQAALDMKIWTTEQLETEQTKRKLKYNLFRKIVKRKLILLDGFSSARKYDKYQRELSKQTIVETQTTNKVENEINE